MVAAKIVGGENGCRRRPSSSIVRASSVRPSSSVVVVRRPCVVCPTVVVSRRRRPSSDTPQFLDKKDPPGLYFRINGLVLDSVLEYGVIDIFFAAHQIRDPPPNMAHPHIVVF